MKVSFVEIFEDVTKYGAKISKDSYLTKGKYPIIDQGQNYIAGYSNEKNGVFTDVPAIIFGDHTRIIKYIDFPCFLGADGVKLLKTKNDIWNYKYLYYSLCYNEIPNTGYNRHYKYLKEISINYYGIYEQTLIANKLDKINHLIDIKKTELIYFEQIVKSRFIELFGDPVINPFSWDTKKLLDMGYCKNGMNFHTGDYGVKINCLGVGDFKDLFIIDNTEQLPYISLNEIPADECMLKDEDIVFVRSNGNKELVGRCLVVYPKNNPTTYSGFCIRYRRTSDDVNTIYLLYVLKCESIRKQMLGRGANIQNLNQQILSNLIIPIPPIELQEQFSNFAKQIDKSKLAIEKSIEKLEILKKSLMQKYFG